MRNLLRKTMPFLFWLLAAHIAGAADASLTTLAERSGFQRTGRYEEVGRLCAAFEARWASSIRCIEFGPTPQGRPMQALVASADGVLDQAVARQRNRPVAVMQGGIHAGEVDGKDAGFLALREMLEGRAAKGV